MTIKGNGTRIHKDRTDQRGQETRESPPDLCPITWGNAVSRRVVIGLDGVPFSLIGDLAGNGVMPNLGSIIQKSIFRQMDSSIPEISSVAWSSIITGANPGEHGIYGFSDVAPDSYRVCFPNFSGLRVSPFWMDEAHGNSVIVNVPSTYPAGELHGVLIAGFVALELNKAVYPQSLAEQLEEMDYRVDVDSKKAHQSMELFLRDLSETLESRIEAYRYLWDGIDWETFMLVFTGTDRLSHFLWSAYEDESHRFHADFLDHFRRIDEVVGEISDRLNDDDLLVMLSDHGFERLEESVNVNVYLRENGFLKLRKQPSRSLNDIDDGTVAFALEPGRIYINMAGRYPRGGVTQKDVERVVDDLIQALEPLEINGRRAISHIFRKEEVYRGGMADRAPDLVLMPGAGFDLKARIASDELIEEDIFTGKHNQHDAFLLVSDHALDALDIPERPSVFDVANILRDRTQINAD